MGRNRYIPRCTTIFHVPLLTPRAVCWPSAVYSMATASRDVQQHCGLRRDAPHAQPCSAQPCNTATTRYNKFCTCEALNFCAVLQCSGIVSFNSQSLTTPDLKPGQPPFPLRPHGRVCRTVLVTTVIKTTQLHNSAQPKGIRSSRRDRRLRIQNLCACTMSGPK